jgi:hypothetical protein
MQHVPHEILERRARSRELSFEREAIVNERGARVGAECAEVTNAFVKLLKRGLAFGVRGGWRSDSR